MLELLFNIDHVDDIGVDSFEVSLYIIEWIWMVSGNCIDFFDGLSYYCFLYIKYFR